MSLINQTLAPSRHGDQKPAVNQIQISIIIPVRNEEPILFNTLLALRHSKSLHSIEIIVVNGESRDPSLAAAENLADKVLITKSRGRAEQMHKGALAAKGDLLIFLHADTGLPENWEEILWDAWQQNPKPAATAFRLGFDSPKFYYKLISKMSDWRCRWITGVPHGDQAIAVWRKTYLEIGGFPLVPLMEEYQLMSKLKPLGAVKLLPAQVKTSARRYEKNGPLVNNLRNLLIIFLFYLGMPTEKLAKLYR